MLLLETGMLGVFVALDLFLFYVFWEAMLVPMYFIIGIWGGAAPRLRRGQVLPVHDGRLAADAGGDPRPLLPARSGHRHLHLRPARCSRSFVLPAGRDQDLLFLAFALAFAIKVPMFPFHTWLPDAHVEAPTAGSVILAGVLLKMGTYGFLRFACRCSRDASLASRRGSSPSAVVGIIYGAWSRWCRRTSRSWSRTRP